MLEKPADKPRCPPAHCSPKDLEIFTEEEIRKLRIFFINCTLRANCLVATVRTVAHWFHAVAVLQELGQHRRIKVRQRLVATACVYFKRFYHKCERVPLCRGLRKVCVYLAPTCAGIASARSTRTL
jgi:hypothetical protein